MPAADQFTEKTAAELRFFADNPAFYEPALVEAARRELSRRGLLPAPGLPVGSTPESAVRPAIPSTRGRGPWLAGLAVLAALLVGGGVLWQRQAAATEEGAAPTPATTLSKGPPRLETVETLALPDFSAATAASGRQQLARVPAAELARLAAQPRRQYRELTRRFWAAETLSEHLIEQARRGQPNPMLAEQAVLVREAWQQWNKAAVYSYSFGPVMRGHLDRMGRAASLQQHVLAELADLVGEGQSLRATPALRQRDDEVQDLLSGLLPISPVTGRAYRQLHRRIEVRL